MTPIKLRSGREIPANGFGTWKAERGEAAAALRAALDAGYRHIDCAAVYMNEKELGEVFADYLKGDNPKLQRSELFITSKVWNTCHAEERVVEACKRSLADLQLDYVDLYLIHHPYAWEFAGLPIDEGSWRKLADDGSIDRGSGVSLEATWRGMERVADAGLARDIGVSNYSAVLLADLLQYARILPAVNQCEAHVNNTRAELRDVCRQFGVHFTMYSILGSGKDGPLGDPIVAEIAKSVSASPAQVLIAWGLGKGCSVLAKSTKKDRIQGNFEADRVNLSGEQVARLDGLNRNLLVCNMSEYWGFPSHV